MADQSIRDTDEFPVVTDPADPVDPMSSYAVSGSAITVGKARQRNRTGGILMGFLIGVVLIIIGGAVYFLANFGWQPGDSDTAASSTTMEIPEETTPVQPVRRSPEPNLPAGFIPINEAARNGTPAGDLNNVYTGTATTSEGFALAVRDEFIRRYLDTGELDAVVQATSPVTNQTYDMICSDNGEYVTCIGGNNAIVYIA